MRPDVIVVGLGSMGAATAYHLARRGASVLGLDQFTPPHDRGSHAGGSRIIRMAYAEGAAYVPLLRRAYELWREAEAAGGRRLLTPTGGLTLGRPDAAAVAGALASARAHGLAHEVLDAAAVRRRFPAFTPADDEVGLYEDAAGLLRPEAAIETYLGLAARHGAELRYGVPVVGWQATDDGVVVDTADGELSAARLVLCAGAWAPGLLADIGAAVRIQRRVQHYWGAPGPGCVWLWDTTLEPDGPGLHAGRRDTFVAYGLPATGDPGLLGGAKVAFHDGDDPADAALGNWGHAHLRQAAAPAEPAGESGGRARLRQNPAPAALAGGVAAVRADEAEPVRRWLATRLPELAAGQWLGGKECLYALTPDENFLLGSHPRHEQVAVAAGFSGHGFKFAPVVGEILADLVLTGGTEHPIGIFAPGRFTAADAS